MKVIDQPYRCKIPGQVFGVWQLECRLQIYFPHPEQQTVVISDMALATGSFIPYRVEHLANLIVEEFGLNPELVVWIEHYTSEFPKPSCTDFSKVIFDWVDGKATNPLWVPIFADVAQSLAGGKLQALSMHRN